MRVSFWCLAVFVGLVVASPLDKNRSGTADQQKDSKSKQVSCQIRFFTNNVLIFYYRIVEPTEYWCDPILGCLILDDSWFQTPQRPLNDVPFPREKINTRFILHTRERPTQDTMLYADDPDTIRYFVH